MLKKQANHKRQKLGIQRTQYKILIKVKILA